MTRTYDVREKTVDYPRLRGLYAQWSRLARYCLGDFYPRTPYGVGEDVWMAWEFLVPNLQEWMIQAYRRPKSPVRSARLRLSGLGSDSTYRVLDLDSSTAVQPNGRELMEEGVPPTIGRRPGSVIVTFERSRKR